MSTDRIEKKILLHAPLRRVWQAFANSSEFGAWFGLKFDGPFTPGAEMRAVLVGTKANAEVAKAHEKYVGLKLEITIVKMEPERLFSFRWHPNAIERDVDYSKEPTTLVEFTLQETAEGVLVTVTESGFENIPLARRATAFTANTQGWSMMINMIGDYLAQRP
jgi:uncharacterized protein YndB with AHSA1/START domain